MEFFSQRNSHSPKLTVQVGSMDQGLRNGLWSAIVICILQNADAYNDETERSSRYDLAMLLWHHFFKKPHDDLPGEWSDFVNFLKRFFMDCKWHQAYSMIEALIKYGKPSKNDRYFDKHDKEISNFIKFLNATLERDNAGYRVIDEKVTTITDPVAIETVNSAAAQERFTGAATHIKQAITKFSDRTNPDYANSIKEAVSAMESAARDWSGNQAIILSEAIRKMPLHPCMKQAVEKFYAYCGDAPGIRHALKDGEKPPTKDDAQFALSLSSAVVNFMIGLAAKPS